MGPLLELVFLEFEQGFLLLLNKKLLLNFFNALLERPMVLLDLLDLRRNDYLFVVNTILMSFMEVSFFSQFVPC